MLYALLQSSFESSSGPGSSAEARQEPIYHLQLVVLCGLELGNLLPEHAEQ